jgi:hypothetical protein
MAAGLPALLGAVILYVIGVAAGTALFFVPGIWVLVLWYFAAQAVVVDGQLGLAALRRSGEVVKGHWWRVFAITAFIAVVGAALSAGGEHMARALGALSNTPIHMLSLSATGINLTIVVDGEQVSPVMRKLHAEFFHDGAPVS